jgi:hypothetical protein
MAPPNTINFADMSRSPMPLGFDNIIAKPVGDETR